MATLSNYNVLYTCLMDESLTEYRYVFLRVTQYNTTRIFWGPLLNALAENVLFKHKSPIAQAHGRDNPSPDVLGLG